MGEQATKGYGKNGTQNNNTSFSPTQASQDKGDNQHIHGNPYGYVGKESPHNIRDFRMKPVYP
jgi:hypothetical protein